MKVCPAKKPFFYRAHLEEQVDAWPLPQGLPHSAQTHFGSGGFENTVVVLIANPDNTNSAINIGYKNFFIYLPLLFIIISFIFSVVQPEGHVNVTTACF